MFKKIFSVVLMAVIAAACISVVFASGDELEILPGSGYSFGDVNMDRKVDVKDATAIQKHLAALATLSNDQLLLADVDFSGATNIKDATYIQKQIAGLVKPMRPTTPPIQETEDVTESEATASKTESTTIAHESTAPLTDPTEATVPSTSVATDPTEVTEPTKATDATEVTDPTEATEATEATKVTEITESTEPTKETRDPNKPIELPFIPAF
ncbi:MAG: hypothetical protein IJD19_00145 [Ruminococcus sp.]|nr:hypothetical protein [Ruminococcus sp.]